jgi:ABC-type lipoprotein export system ATPase subunit
MEEGRIEELLSRLSIGELFTRYPYIENLFEGSRLTVFSRDETLMDFLAGCHDEYFTGYGFTKPLFAQALIGLIEKLECAEQGERPELESITIMGGKDKSGKKEDRNISIHRGEIISVVGPTGAGKTRLLEDIECLAQGDTPTGRHILLNGAFPNEEERWRLENRMVAQLSQNMNFVADLPVYEFLKIHAESRSAMGKPVSVQKQVPGSNTTDKIIEKIIACANSLAGEPFDPASPVTSLSGGQSRSLMIADTALLSESPIILIDEIENAGIDRRQAMNILSGGEKIIIISTHDPALALMGRRRIVIQNGGIFDVLERTSREEENLAFLEHLDSRLLSLRNSIRGGGRIENNIRQDLLEETYE